MFGWTLLMMIYAAIYSSETVFHNCLQVKIDNLIYLFNQTNIKSRVFNWLDITLYYTASHDVLGFFY